MCPAGGKMGGLDRQIGAITEYGEAVAGFVHQLISHFACCIQVQGGNLGLFP